MVKVMKEKFKTYNDVFDNYTLHNLFKLSAQGFFEELQSPVSIGKEANIFTALRKDGSKVIVKIYRLETCDFNRMYEYIRYDTRLPGLKRTKRQIIFAWARREYRNLLRARDKGVSVPTPYTVKDNIIIMELVGKDEPAPKLNKASPEDPKAFFNQIINNMKKLYKAGIIHGDLSPFNILNDNERAVFIDISHGSAIDSANAEDLLKRDIKNVCSFFKKLGLKIDEDKIYDQIKKSAQNS